ncbi:hypothetical protein C1H46_013443 [Malus baccata]|uniref:Uncharacterized protein n=1 Tax=Malus baccata TaxID=106549 RepID=A0A540MRM6_MALBA|nr:hypothetical protein C1H46_013443 [Malus baccata]
METERPRERLRRPSVSRASSARRRASQRRMRGRESSGGWWRCSAGIGVDGFRCAWVWVRLGKWSFLCASPCFPETEENEGEFRRVMEMLRWHRGGRIWVCLGVGAIGEME